MIKVYIKIGFSNFKQLSLLVVSSEKEPLHFLNSLLFMRLLLLPQLHDFLLYILRVARVHLHSREHILNGFFEILKLLIGFPSPVKGLIRLLVCQRESGLLQGFLIVLQLEITQ